MRKLLLAARGNDTTYVLAGEISACLITSGDAGNDSVNFIGYGAYSLFHPFGLPGWIYWGLDSGG